MFNQSQTNGTRTALHEALRRNENAGDMQSLADGGEVNDPKTTPDEQQTPDADISAAAAAPSQAPEGPPANAASPGPAPMGGAAPFRAPAAGNLFGGTGGVPGLQTANMSPQQRQAISQAIMQAVMAKLKAPPGMTAQPSIAPTPNVGGAPAALQGSAGAVSDYR